MLVDAPPSTNVCKVVPIMVKNDPPVPRHPAAAVFDARLSGLRSDTGSRALAGMIPILMAIPFMYWPRLLEGDTQPWVAAGAALSALFFWPKPREHDLKKLYLPMLAAAACMAVYALRETDSQSVLRYVGILATFMTLWMIACRGGQSFVSTAIKFTVVLWFIIAAYQIVAIRLGFPVEFFGRYIASRSGVPSLTAEPSFYGSISVLQMMYLISEEKKSNTPYVIVALASVFLSGSILSYLFLIVPLMRLPTRYKLTGAAVLLLISTQGIRLSDSGFFSRLSSIDFSAAISDPAAILTRDASTNLRVGHVKFSIFDNFERSLFLENESSFRVEYNNWAFQQRRYIYNESDFILTSAGEMFFRSGLFGIFLVITLIVYSYKSVSTYRRKVEKVIFVMLCFLSPVGLSNPFFVFFIIQKEQP